MRRGSKAGGRRFIVLYLSLFAERFYSREANAFLFPSFYESFGYVIIEASASHLPLILWDNTGYPEYLYDHYLKAQDEAGLAEILNCLCKDRVYYDKWQEEAARLAERYEIERFFE